MASAVSLRWSATILLLTTMLIHIAYGAYYVAPAFPTAAPAFYLMGIIYLVGVGALASNIRPRIFQRLALVYVIILILLWAAAGARDIVAYIDKH